MRAAQTNLKYVFGRRAQRSPPSQLNPYSTVNEGLPPDGMAGTGVLCRCGVDSELKNCPIQRRSDAAFTLGCLHANDSGGGRQSLPNPQAISTSSCHSPYRADRRLLARIAGENVSQDRLRKVAAAERSIFARVLQPKQSPIFGQPSGGGAMRRLALVVALACAERRPQFGTARADADEELRLRVNIPRIDVEAMHESAFASIDAAGEAHEVELVVSKGEAPEKAAMKLCLKEVGPGAGLVDCIVQLASHATVERVLKRTPVHEPLPALTFEVEGMARTFAHEEDGDFDEEALKFCSEVVNEDRTKSIVKNCARNLKAQARRKVTQLLVDEQTSDRRKAIEKAVDASFGASPEAWAKARRRRKKR